MRLAIAAGMAVALLVGCAEKKDEKTFVIVNGHPVTDTFVKESVLVQARISELAGSPIATNDFKKWANTTAASVLRANLAMLLLEDEFEKKGVRILPEDESLVLTNFNLMAAQKARSKEDLAANFGDLSARFIELFDRSVKVTAYERAYCRFKADDRLVSQYLSILSNEVEEVSRIDAAARKNAEAAYRRLQSGESWAKVADACSEDKLQNPQDARFARLWTTVGADARGIPELAAALPSMKKGDYTKPIETRDGILIIRLEAKIDRFYRLSRMLFRMGKVIKIPKTAEEARMKLEADTFNKLRNDTISRLWKSARLEYPLGTNFVYKIWN